MLSSISVGKVDAYPLVEPQDIANITSNPFPFIGLFKLKLGLYQQKGIFLIFVKEKHSIKSICAKWKIVCSRLKNNLAQNDFSFYAKLFYHFNLLILCKLEQNNPKSDC